MDIVIPGTLEQIFQMAKSNPIFDDTIRRVITCRTRVIISLDEIYQDDTMWLSGSDGFWTHSKNKNQLICVFTYIYMIWDQDILNRDESLT